MADEFSRTALLLGDEAMARLRRARVAVFGIGGVGSYAAEALARAGVGALDLIDNDTVSITNLNRQLFALHSTVGRPKVDAARERLADVAPGCTVRTHALFYLPETAEAILPHTTISSTRSTPSAESCCWPSARPRRACR